MTPKFDTKEIAALIPKLEKFRRAIVPIVGGVLTKQIKVLSQQQQRDFTGSAFAPLTPAYKKWKEGYRGKGKRGPSHPGVPNLTLTGKFMDRIGLRPDGSVGVVESFLPQAEGLDKKRKIWGVHPDSIRNSEKALQDAWEGIVG